MDDSCGFEFFLHFLCVFPLPVMDCFPQPAVEAWAEAQPRPSDQPPPDAAVMQGLAVDSFGFPLFGNAMSGPGEIMALVTKFNLDDRR